jgi:hypothetical protein
MTNGIDCGQPADNWWYAITPVNLVVDFPPFQGVINADFYAEIREAGTTTPATVIDVDDAFAIDIHLDLKINSPLQNLLCGFWCISFCLESLCGDSDYRFPQDSTDPPGFCCLLVPFNCNTTYDATICVPGDIVQESECGSAYEGTVIVTLLSNCYRTGLVDPDPNDPGSYIPVGAAGSFQLPLLTFYDDSGGDDSGGDDSGGN